MNPRQPGRQTVDIMRRRINNIDSFEFASELIKQLLTVILTDILDDIQSYLEQNGYILEDITQDLKEYDIQNPNRHLVIKHPPDTSNQTLGITLKRYELRQQVDNIPPFPWYLDSFEPDWIDLQRDPNEGYHRYSYNLYLHDSETGNTFPTTTEPYKAMAVALLKLYTMFASEE